MPRNDSLHETGGTFVIIFGMLFAILFHNDTVRRLAHNVRKVVSLSSSISRLMAPEIRNKKVPP